ncbi:hypothetical protein [Mycolicibacterium phlei]|uniref:hypothetical protein n=1 Tax=Mycolicibacterium phlei TaxID=1771 RepID=UPI0012641D71|nr:hypothetical protein [Mycolicibacterium phlei]
MSPPELLTCMPPEVSGSVSVSVPALPELFDDGVDGDSADSLVVEGEVSDTLASSEPDSGWA